MSTDAGLIAFARARTGEQVEQASFLRRLAVNQGDGWRSLLGIATQLDRDSVAKAKLVETYEATCMLRDGAATRIRDAGDSPSPKDLELWDQADRKVSILTEPMRLLVLPHADHPAYEPRWEVG